MFQKILIAVIVIAILMIAGAIFWPRSSNAPEQSASCDKDWTVVTDESTKGYLYGSVAAITHIENHPVPVLLMPRVLTPLGEYETWIVVTSGSIRCYRVTTDEGGE